MAGIKTSASGASQLVKFTLEQAIKAQTGEQRYSCTLSFTSAQDGVGDQRQAPAALPPGDPVPIVGGWVGRRAGLDGCGKSRPHRDSIIGPSSP
jgi:hypothetical protein